MPAYNDSSSPSGEEMYSDSPDSSAAPAADESKEETGETTLVPKSICPGMKAGEEMVLKIVSVQDDQYVVAYAPKEDAKEESGESKRKYAGDGEMASMMD